MSAQRLRSPTRHLAALAAAALFVLGLFGCSGGGGSASDGGGGGGGTNPEILLSANQILFPNVVAEAAGLRPADRSVEVQNTGRRTSPSARSTKPS